MEAFETIMQYMWIVAIVLVVILIITLLVSHGRIRRLKKKIATLEEKNTEQNTELEHLQARLMQHQIRPHFIFNSLLAIKQLCIESPKAAAEALQHFASYLRTNLEAMTSEEMIPFSQEILSIKEYVALEQADPASRFLVRYDVDFDDFELPILTVQPMVENAIRHGIATRKGDGVVTIRTALEEENVVITVEDNGQGVPVETRQQAEHRSTGIQNVKERLRLLCNGELATINTGHGTIVRITIPRTDLFDDETDVEEAKTKAENKTEEEA
ncbi:MAG: histidine kinase [Lachnospiraceae bacterium]|nr:histidine kinase [Lachnospiraceae bacterium]